LVELVSAPTAPGFALVVLEDFTRLNGHLLIVNARGAQIDLAKSSESTSADPLKFYLGLTVDEVTSSAKNLPGAEIPARPGDPSYDQVAGIFAPVQRMPTYSFVGTPDTFDKVGFPLPLNDLCLASSPRRSRVRV
jgi:hypothetical protein